MAIRRRSTRRGGPVAVRPRRSARTSACALTVILAGSTAAWGCATGAAPGPSAAVTPASLETTGIARRVEVRRTTYGVPHILAQDLRAAAFALAYVQAEDYGERVIRGVIGARGEAALIDGYGRVDGDFQNRRRRARAAETFDRLAQDTRDVYEGFAEGLNHFIRVYHDELPDWVRPDITGQDVLARDIQWPSDAVMEPFRRRLIERESGGSATRLGRGVLMHDDEDDVAPGRLVVVDEIDPNVGSNAWALAPSRTTSGHAILLRNPHLAWNAGYYEAHVRVPGALDFYGDFRIGGPFTVIGGFNPYLGFATTNNATRSHEFYAFHVDPDTPDHFLLDGASIPLERELVTVQFRNGPGTGTETREFWTSPFGPVLHRDDGMVYVYRPAGTGEYRAGEQWLAMMKARNLDEWKGAMRMQARATSNFTYADRDGNIFYTSVSMAPVLPHPPGGDTLAITAERTDQVWSRLVPFDSLPHVLNPPGGYIHNENDSPHFTNLNRVLDHETFSFWVQEPRLRLRSQHAIELLHNDRTFSLEDVVDAKHSMRMLLADRVKADLIAAVRRSEPDAEVRRAIDRLDAWDNTVAADSRGGVLFQTWWDRYRELLDDSALFATEWDAQEPATTPQGLANPTRAVEAFEWAVPETARRFGSWDVAWGDVHRVRYGDVDAPVGGCGGELGCFRVLRFRTDTDGRRVVNGGDGWVIAVEFSDPPRAYSVLGYGQSPDPDSPWHDNQAALFAASEMKPVRWTEADIARATVQRYHPGTERDRTAETLPH
ncbi:MAG: penicillin acylase family protein [Longimicrobiales bacterium]